MSVITYLNYSFIACWLRLSHLWGLSWSMPALSGISHKGHLKDRDGPKKTRSCSLRPLGHTASVDDMIAWLNWPILEHQRYDTSGHVLQGRQQTCGQEPQATRSRKGYNRAYWPAALTSGSSPFCLKSWRTGMPSPKRQCIPLPDVKRERERERNSATLMHPQPLSMRVCHRCVPVRISTHAYSIKSADQIRKIDNSFFFFFQMGNGLRSTNKGEKSLRRPRLEVSAPKISFRFWFSFRFVFCFVLTNL